MRITSILLFCCGFAIHAHSTSIYADYAGNTLKGRAYSGGQGVADATIYFSTPDHKELGSTQTDADGNFEFEPESKVSVECVLKLSDGHGARYLVDVGEHKHTAHDHHGSGKSDESEDIHDEIRELKMMIVEQSRRNGIRDAVGGIGYILGIAGIVVLLKNKKPA